MQCQNCQKNPATVHLTEIQDAKMSELHLCQACANEKGLAGGKAVAKFSIADLLANMVDGMSNTEEERVGPVQCGTCGMHYSALKETGRLGCPECYTTFQTKLRPLLRRIHGATRHVGKLPVGDGEQVPYARQVQRLHDELQRAVEREEFEHAAELRDQIKRLEQSRPTSTVPPVGGERS